MTRYSIKLNLNVYQPSLEHLSSTIQCFFLL